MSKMPSKNRPLESKVKKKIRDMLDRHDWFWWNVPMNAYAKAGISDIHAVKDGMFMVIEGKRDAKEDPTVPQIGFLNSIAACGHFAFVVHSDNLDMLDMFLAANARAIAAVSKQQQPTPEDGAAMLNAIKSLTEKY